MLEKIGVGSKLWTGEAHSVQQLLCISFYIIGVCKSFTLIPNMWYLSTIWWLYSRLKVPSDEKTPKKMENHKFDLNLAKTYQTYTKVISISCEI